MKCFDEIMVAFIVIRLYQSDYHDWSFNNNNQIANCSKMGGWGKSTMGKFDTVRRMELISTNTNSIVRSHQTSTAI